ncbi:hypothetical protein BURCENK562V_C5156 [Burkholderia cenocepacia K56-2Valvano]|nr:hypothetical protein BURCENK562V_C5156 [Burkholderia cenocepacia K56-2Valvano]
MNDFADTELPGERFTHSRFRIAIYRSVYLRNLQEFLRLRNNVNK